MNIIKHNWAWRFTPSLRKRTDAIVLHHAAIKTASAEDIHYSHLQRDGGTWAGIGYNFYIRKNGEVHEGRPLEAAGAHTAGYNSTTLGVCCEGNYDVETTMPAAQLKALRELLAYLKGIYPNAEIKRHRDYQATACPGRYFPYREALNYETAGETAEREDDDMIRYNTVAELPEAYRADVQTLIDKGLLKGKGDVNHLDLTEDMARVLIVYGRMEGVLE